MSDFVIGNVYNFSTKAPAILGATFTGVKVIGLVSYDIAITMANIDYKQRVVLPLLPQGTPTDPKSYQYVLFITQSGDKQVLALPWIEISTIELQTGTTVTSVVSNVSLSDVDKIRKLLIAAGYTNLSITTS